MAKSLDIRQLDSVVQPLLGLPAGLGVGRGWIAAVQKILGMTSIQLANRIGIERSGVTHFQHRERTGAISIESMQRIASALECDLIYAFVPRAGSFEATVRARARIAAARELAHAAHTMALEGQPVPSEESEHQLRELTERLTAERPSWIWDDATGA